MTNEVILRNRTSGAIYSLVIKEDGSLWTEADSKVNARMVFFSLAHAAANRWDVEKIGLPMEFFA